MSKRRKIAEKDSVAEGQKSDVDQARFLCASDQDGSVEQLREMAMRIGSISNVSTLTKTQLCAALEKAIGSKSEGTEQGSSTAAAAAGRAKPKARVSPSEALSFTVEQEDAPIPEGCLDMITQDIMYDPIVASDGYSYDRSSLRNLFVTEQRRFIASGRSVAHPRRVKSLRVFDEALKNPFNDIPGWPVEFMLFPNRSLRETIVAWLDAHGLPRDRPAEELVEPPETQRDVDGFFNGIFYQEPEEEEEESVARRLIETKAQQKKTVIVNRLLASHSMRPLMARLRAAYSRGPEATFNANVLAPLLTAIREHFAISVRIIPVVGRKIFARSRMLEFETWLGLMSWAVAIAHANDRITLSRPDLRKALERANDDEEDHDFLAPEDGDEARRPVMETLADEDAESNDDD
jgi:hypothetical protein